MLNLFLFILGSVWGSFLNVVIGRLPNDESIVFPASHCPQCKHKLNLFDLFPLLSFILLKRKCRYCSARIPFRYFWVELLSGASLVLAYSYFPFKYEYLFVAAFLFILIAIAFIDFETQLIPESLIFLGGGVGLARALFGGTLLQALWGAAFGFVFLFLISKIAFLYYKKEAMGFGDVELGAMLGVLLGWSLIIYGIFWAYMIAGVVSVGLLALKRVQLSDGIAFAPFLILGAVYVFFCGSLISFW